MSAVAYALSLFTENLMPVYTLTRVIGEYRRLPDDAARSYRALLRDHYEELANILADRVRGCEGVPRDAESLGALMDATTIPPPPDPPADAAEAYFSTLAYGLVTIDPNIEVAIRGIILRAVACPSCSDGWSAQRTGRPRTNPTILDAIAEAHKSGQEWKDVARSINDKHNTDYTHTQVRDLYRKNHKRE